MRSQLLARWRDRARADADGRRVTLLLVLITSAVALATIVGLAALWPSGGAPDLAGTTAGIPRVDASVTDVTVDSCVDPGEGLPADCQVVSAQLGSGPSAGEDVTFLSSLLDFRTPTFEPGDDVVLAYNELAPPDFQYAFVEFQREAPLVLLGAAFVVVVVAFGRWKGLRALAGLAVSLLVIVWFLLPSLLRDNNAVAVALVTTSIIGFAALYLAHGVSRSTTVALLGTFASVAVITALAAIVSAAANLTGLTDETFQTLRVTAEAVDPRGILIAGTVIGALGVLDDVTVTQVSAVSELRRVRPDLTRRQLYDSAVRIGRDHVASTVNTLVLAYVGASLALMLFFVQEGRSISQVLTREVVAIEIVRTLVGSLGLILSVPLTTGLAVLVGISGDDHGHHGGHAHHGGLSPLPAGPPRPHEPSWDDFAPPDDGGSRGSPPRPRRW